MSGSVLLSMGATCKQMVIRATKLLLLKKILFALGVWRMLVANFGKHLKLQKVQRTLLLSKVLST